MGIDRRDFVKLVAAGALAGCADLPYATDQDTLVSVRSVPSNRLVRVYNERMTGYAFSGLWTDYNETPEFRCSLVSGIKSLSGETSEERAWQSLLVGYQPGDTVTIKLNHNNVGVGNDSARPNTSVAMTAAVVQSLLNFGLSQSQITVYDCVRNVGTWWTSLWYAAYPGVTYVNKNTAVWDTQHPLVFPNGATLYLPMNVVNAQHVINLSLLKGHGSYATGAMKNHFGTINNPTALHTDRHRQIAYLNTLPDILGKTRLCVCEAHMLAYPDQDDYYAPAEYTDLFPGGKFNSLVLSQGGFVLDNLVADVINFERQARGLGAWPNEFLTYGQSYGLGVREQATLVDGQFSAKDLHYDGIEYVSYDAHKKGKLPDEPEISTM